jgi:putative Holliday junction resolvase
VGRVLGVDWGERRLGLAVSDPTGLIAQGAGAVEVHSPAEAAERVVHAAHQWEVERVVVGLPLNMDGTEGDAARRARELARAVEAKGALPVATWDERLTTMQAERQLRETRPARSPSATRKARARGEVDQRAAILLLQSYLDFRGSRGPTGESSS